MASNPIHMSADKVNIGGKLISNLEAAKKAKQTDPKQAFKYFEKAAEDAGETLLNQGEAWFNIGEYYLSGTAKDAFGNPVVEKDEAFAIKCFQNANDRGNQSGKLALDTINKSKRLEETKKVQEKLNTEVFKTFTPQHDVHTKSTEVDDLKEINEQMSKANALFNDGDKDKAYTQYDQITKLEHPLGSSRDKFNDIRGEAFYKMAQINHQNIRDNNNKLRNQSELEKNIRSCKALKYHEANWITETILGELYRGEHESFSSSKKLTKQSASVKSFS